MRELYDQLQYQDELIEAAERAARMRQQDIIELLTVRETSTCRGQCSSWRDRGLKVCQ